MFYYVYTDHAQYTIKTYAKMALFPLLLTGPLSMRDSTREPDSAHDTSENQICQKLNAENTFLAVILTRILESVCTRQTNHP